ncbi:MAG: hypothetical protein KDA27_08240 [Candidatus Eisenbacteria bacterium]|uniref:Uncharacterized protein n=1 Tax=Eiseniibacteriota bacterium TaxID=2212470 RepID=A0A956NE67_UNCEI|nr:hypothetical protein [Candidatus Eisenbacteria bacterium]MCB9463591.1 hypothetical protein [Candidatus Eisenbacteria bacterium]
METTKNTTVGPIEARYREVGEELSGALRGLFEDVPVIRHVTGTVKVAGLLGIDKVLASRLLKSMRAGDPLATLHAAPGPQPLRRVIEGFERLGVSPQASDRADRAVSEFERLIREDAGDRSALQTLISAWLPEARREFELRRKQSAFRAMSEIYGCLTETLLATVFLHPSARDGMIDIVWLIGSLGLRRLRPNARVRFASRRYSSPGQPRRPMTLGNERVEDLRGLLLSRFCNATDADLDVHEMGEVTRYVVAGDRGFATPLDFVFAEVNREEIEQTLVPGATRSAYLFAEVDTPSRRLLFDVLLHESIYPGKHPRLLIYDTAFEGVASVNDRSRDLDRLELEESVAVLDRGLRNLHTPALPRYTEMVGEVFESMGWDSGDYRGFRTEIDYPIYGSQVTMSFDPDGSGEG